MIENNVQKSIWNFNIPQPIGGLPGNTLDIWTFKNGPVRIPRVYQVGCGEY